MLSGVTKRMFEIVVSLCLLGEPGICRTQLLAGLETASEEECVTVLQNLDPGSRLDPAPEYSFGKPACREMPDGIALEEVAAGVFVHTGEISEPDPGNLGDIANLGVVVGDTSIAVIDAGGARGVGEDLYRAIRKISALPVGHLVLTHVHPDHVFGASVFAEAGARIVGHPNLVRALRDREQSYLESFRAEIGASGFLGTRVDFEVLLPSGIDLGGRSLELKSWPMAHSTSDLTVLDVQTGTLFTGDLVFHRHVPVLDGSLKGWLSVLDELETLEAVRIVPGHGSPSLRVEEGLAPVREYLRVLQDQTRQSLDAGSRMSDAVTGIAQDQRPRWELFDAFNIRNATVAFTELEWD